jgi:hypothetical protein
LRAKISSSLSALGGAGAGAAACGGGGGGGGGAGAAGGAGGGGGGGGIFFAQAVTVNVTNKTIVVNHTHRRRFIELSRIFLGLRFQIRVELSVRSIPCQLLSA